MTTPDLFTPLKLGAVTTKNRIYMAPLTRTRAGPGNVPRALNAEYYRQRASAGLIISEATQVSPRGQGYPRTPGIHTQAQADGWKLVTDAVHQAGGLIYAQLWHVGRVSHNAYQPDGEAPVSSSAVAKRTPAMLPDGTQAPSPTPRALETREIAGVIDEYRKAAVLAKQAGFDGVELHGANGYLPDQFLRDSINHRTDQYGGSIPNRARFHLEATHAIAEVFGADRVGVRLSPSGTFSDVSDSTPRETFGYVVRELDKLGLSYLHIMEAMKGDLTHGPNAAPGYEAIPVSYFRAIAKHTPIITNAGFTFGKATAYVKEGWADAVAFGELFIANPDLVERFRRFGDDAPLNAANPATYYGLGAEGYTDYPFLPKS